MGTTSSSSVSPASASDNNKNERARFSTDQRIPSLQTVASAPIVQGQFSQEQDANNVKKCQKQLPKDQVIPNNNSVNVPRNSKEAVTVATSSVMFVNSPPKSSLPDVVNDSSGDPVNDSLWNNSGSNSVVIECSTKSNTWPPNVHPFAHRTQQRYTNKTTTTTNRTKKSPQQNNNLNNSTGVVVQVNNNNNNQ